MKLLFDENLSFGLCAQLADLFPESLQVRLAGLAEASDRAIWATRRRTVSRLFLSIRTSLIWPPF